MARARPKESPTDHHARGIAAAIAKGGQPSFTPDLELYFEHSPHEIFTAFEGAARHMPPAGKDNALASGYLIVLQGLLQHLRYRVDRGYSDAVGLIADFQTAVAEQAAAGCIDGHLLACVGRALHQAKIPASAELAAASTRAPVGEDESARLRVDLRGALAGMLEAVGNDPFAFVEALAEFGHGMPKETRVALVDGMARGGTSHARSAAVLVVLDADPHVRCAAAAALGEAASSLSPVDVRRLTAIRNWRPEHARGEIDSVIRKARAAGIPCAPWEASSVESIRATGIDGSAAQAFLLVSPAGRKQRISSILTRRGVADAWSAEPESRRRVEAAAAGMEAPMLPVSRRYLDRMMAHHLALGAENGEAPPPGLLQVAETIGGADWQPARIDVGDCLVRLIAELPEAMRRPATIETVLRTSGDMTDLELVEESWFEDGPEIAKLVTGAGSRDRAKLATYLLNTVIARHRDEWADVLLRTALWMREGPADADLCWRELAIVAHAVARGRDLTEIGLMRDIAERTIAALRERRRREQFG
jgi:hypothetical protein